MQRYSEANLDFDFNWNDYRTITTNQTKITAIASLVKTSPPPEDLQSQQELGRLAFKLSAFYNHIKHDPDTAIEFLTIAERFLQGEELAWAKNQWAMMLVQNKQLPQAQQVFEEIQTYWEQHNDPINPYSARFYLIYGDFLKNSHEDNWELALKKYQKAYEITQRIEGEDSPFAKDIDKKITEIIRQHITRFQVHILAHKQKQELKKAIQRFKDFTDSSENIHHPEYIEQLKAISIYYAFYKRDRNAASIYLIKSLAVCKTEEERTAVLCINAYVQTIDPNFTDEDNVFAKVINKLDQLEEKSSYYKKVSTAFVLQYQAMIIHRRAYLNVATTNNIEQALSLINKAIDIQSALIETTPLQKIGLAESIHLKAIMLYRLAVNEQDEIKKQQKFTETEVLFSKAIELEKKFCQETQAPHSLLATTLQSFARLLKNIGRSSEAHEHFHLALEMQTTILGDKPHEDIAKTWHFWAETYAEEQNHEKAIDAFLNALLIKYKIIYANSSITKETENALLKPLDILYTQNKALALIKYQEVYDALTSDENKKAFTNVDMSFTQVIQRKLRECKAITSLRVYSLYSIDPNDSVNNRSQLVEDNQLAAKTSQFQRGNCQNSRR